MKYFGNNYCPYCNTDLSKEYEKYDETGVKDGFECPHCRAVLGYRSIYTVIGLTCWVVGGILGLTSIICSFTDMWCTPLYDHTGSIGAVLFLAGVFFIIFNSSYVLKMPNKSLKRDSRPDRPPAA